MKFVLLVLSLITSACTTAPRVTPVSVAVPVKCKAQVPQRPSMPTESLKPNADAFAIARAAIAEISFREGYEGQLVAALKSCL